MFSRKWLMASADGKRQAGPGALSSKARAIGRTSRATRGRRPGRCRPGRTPGRCRRRNKRALRAVAWTMRPGLRRRTGPVAGRTADVPPPGPSAIARRPSGRRQPPARPRKDSVREASPVRTRRDPSSPRAASSIRNFWRDSSTDSRSSRDSSQSSWCRDRKTAAALVREGVVVRMPLLGGRVEPVHDLRAECLAGLRTAGRARFRHPAAIRPRSHGSAATRATEG